MRMPKRGEKGFTLIELLIVVAILGVLAAVVIPNVGRFIGRGETEAAETELTNIQTAVVSMMVDNQISTLPTPVGTGNATSDMFRFPDITTIGAAPLKETDINGGPFAAGDNDGYVLFQHDLTGNSSNATLVNYTATQYTKGTYTVDAAGTVKQVTTGY